MSSAMRRMMGAKKAAQKAAEIAETAETQPQQPPKESQDLETDLSENVKGLSISNDSISTDTDSKDTSSESAAPAPTPAAESEPSVLAPEPVTEKAPKQAAAKPSKNDTKTPAKEKPDPSTSKSEQTSGKSKKKGKKGAKDESTTPTTPLSVNARLLDPENEIKRIYGNIRLWEEDGAAENFANQLTNHQKKNLEKLSRVWGGKDKKSIPGTTKKLSLVTIKPYWVPQVRSEVGVTRLPAENGDNETFKFTHTDAYAEGEFQFVQRRAIGQDSGDLFAQYPYNVSILNQIASNGLQTGQASESADLIERALYVFNRALLTSSAAILGQSRFPFKYVENRQFYRTLYLYIDILARRGLWNTTLEFSKLINSLDNSDPYGCCYMMDHFAVQGGDTGAVEYMLEKQLAPHIGYSLALARLLDGEDGEAEEALTTAIQTFPWIGYTLAESLNLSHQHRFDASGSDSAIEAQSQLYVLRNRALWDDPKPKMLFTKVWDKVAFTYTRNKGPQDWYNMNDSLRRHLVISGEATLLKYVQPLAESDLYDDDPCPPRSDINVYSGGNYEAASSDVTLAGQNDGTDETGDGGELAPEVVAALAQIQQLCSEVGMDVMEAFQMVGTDIPEAMRGTLLTEVVRNFTEEE